MSKTTPNTQNQDTNAGTIADIDNIDDIDLDITAFLEAVSGTDINENIEPESENIDAKFGADDVDNFLESFDDPVGIDTTQQSEDKITGAADPVRKDEKKYDVEPEGDIDSAITSGDMMSLIYSEIMKKRIAGHHLDSMNSFNKVGIKQIATKVFTVEGRMKNQRDKTEEDNEIAEITYKVEFTDINLTPPTTVKYKSGAV
jgi:hypothetical protein